MKRVFETVAAMIMVAVFACGSYYLFFGNNSLVVESKKSVNLNYNNNTELSVLVWDKDVIMASGRWSDLTEHQADSIIHYYKQKYEK